MPENLNHYRTALYLSIVVGLTNCIVCGLSVFLRPQNIRDAVGLCVLSLAIPAGLWLGSHFVRFAGAVFLRVMGRCSSLALDFVWGRAPTGTITVGVGFWVFSRSKFGDGVNAAAVSEILC